MGNLPLRRTSDLVVQSLGNDTLIYDLNTNKAICLNETAAHVWNLCDGNTSIQEIAEILTSEFGDSASEDLVWLALDQLDESHMLEKGFENNSILSGLNRREVIRKVGLGSMIAIPIVSSITAPHAMFAQSDTCHMTVCIAAMLPLCPPGCTQDFPSLQAFVSTDGSCITPMGTAPVNCSMGPVTSAVDIQFP